MCEMTEAHLLERGKNMLRSMYSGISGLKNFQTKLDVIGNNIANVNTFGFKKGRVTFKDMISQSVAGASAPGDTRGGVNPKQVGLGSQIAAIDTIHTQGNLQTTGRTLDLSLSGDGYFVVGEGSAAAGATAIDNLSYTRAGNFYLDSNGDLVTGDGLFVVGEGSSGFPVLASTLAGAPAAALGTTTVTTTKINIPSDAKDLTIGSDGTVSYIAGPSTAVGAAGDLIVAGKIVLSKFSNTSGLQKTGANLYKPTTNSGDPLYDYANVSGIGFIEPGTLEMSNVDLSEEFTEMIVAQRAFQANTRIITTSDEVLQELVNLKR